MERKFNLEKMLKEVEEDKVTSSIFEKKWASQDDIEKMRKEIKQKEKAARNENKQS